MSSVVSVLSSPLSSPHSLNRSPIRVSSPTCCVWKPVRTSAVSNCAATCDTHARVYSHGCRSGRAVSNAGGRKHGSPASNLNPSSP